MADHTKVVVYLRAGDVRMLKGEGVEDPARWVRGLVKEALAREHAAAREPVVTAET